MKRKTYKKIISVILSLAFLFTLISYASADDTLVPGPTVMKDSSSPTGYTVRFVYQNEAATSVTFNGDILLKNWVDTTDTKVYQPSEYRPGLMRGGGGYSAPMEKRDGGYWVIDVPLAAGANQYWFYVNGNTNLWVTDPANPPVYSPDGLTGNARRAFNKVNVPYDEEKQNYGPMGARVIENPRTDGTKGTWSYVAIPTPIGGKARYLGVYLPYGYDPNRAEPYKTIYMQHGAQQDASDWMNIGSVPVIMDNLLQDGLTEPAVVVSTDSTYMGNSPYNNLENIIIPFVESQYNVSKNRMDRAFAGLSMGGSMTTNIINNNPLRFGYYGIFSLGASVNKNTPNLKSCYILIGGGKWDFGLATESAVAALNGYANYKNLVVAGAHDFNTWCQLFTMFARDYLWQPRAFLEVSGIEDTHVTTAAGVAPVLPGRVTLNWSDQQTTTPANVVWDAIDPMSYATDGTFNVQGTVEGTSLKAKAIVTVTSSAVASLAGPGLISTGETFSLTYGLGGVQGISAQDITVSYDKDKLDFTGATALPEGTSVQQTVNKPEEGTVRFIIVSTGAQNAISGRADILKLDFVSKAQGVSTVAITRAALATGIGEVSFAAVSGISVDAVDKTALAAAITAAQAKLAAATIGAEPGDYPQAAADAFQAVIAAAIDVRDDASATSADLEQAISALRAASTAFSAAVILDTDKAALTTAIVGAQAVYDNAVEGIAIGQYPIGAKDRLNTAIAAATVVKDNPATSAQVSQAITDLNAAVSAFQRLVITGSTGNLNNISGIDIGDLGIIASHYGMKAGDPGWDSIKHADINGDGEIGLYELAFIAMRILGN